MMSLWDALRMNMMISYQELVRTFPNQKMIKQSDSELAAFIIDIALSDSCVKEILLSRLRSTLLVETASDETREYLELMLQRVSVCH
ncbi:hypothetical protein [Klebsiella pneumoniae]|nr:hypothetical protein [Klebsiella pneumoniae]MDY2076988.1 hypothetical protein [Klebsiella pneumoniae]MDZ0389016.1 hypothetical protein [Klebsiella pneumoniae]MDZ0432703.1 hypothetical protein [Klebsiella pneumoniae]MDZ0635319.1 hypothetical protein [Klebsiella pneumoniae]MDZ3185770.1 hypothetical protein [Klebsiella pneumoniae]